MMVKAVYSSLELVMDLQEFELLRQLLERLTLSIRQQWD
jgi:hypothetical protein